MLRFGLRYGLGLATCAGALYGWQQGALAWSTTVKQGAGSSLLVAAKDSNSSIAVAKSKKHKVTAPVAAEEPVPPLPDKKDDKKDDKAATGQTPPAPPAWKPEEIAAAQARCTAILKGIDAVAEPQPPLREGACGAPAPIRLISLGKSPQVAFSPPALVDCELAGALAGWLKNDVQPLAAKRLGAKIVRIEVMSDYSCRTSAGRGAKHLSEHAFANALDIGAFVTEKGNAASVLELLGHTQARDRRTHRRREGSGGEGGEGDRRARSRRCQGAAEPQGPQVRKPICGKETRPTARGRGLKSRHSCVRPRQERALQGRR